MKDPIERQAAIKLTADYLYNLMSPRCIGLTPDHCWKEAEGILAKATSAEPEQTNCEYCHEDSDGYVRPIEKNSHAWLVRRGRTMRLHVCFKGEYRECDILFCPMCGRRLTDG